jgi:transposase
MPPLCVPISTVPAREKNGEKAIGRSRGGPSTKIYALADALSNPCALILPPGQDHDLACAQPLPENTTPGAVIADKAYDADALIDKLTEQGVTPVIRPRTSANAISRSIASEMSLSVSSTRLSTSALLRRAMTNLRETISPQSAGRHDHPSQLKTGLNESSQIILYLTVINDSLIYGRAPRSLPRIRPFAETLRYRRTQDTTSMRGHGLRANPTT